jgi:hypothetical protein
MLIEGQELARRMRNIGWYPQDRAQMWVCDHAFYSVFSDHSAGKMGERYHEVVELDAVPQNDCAICDHVRSVLVIRKLAY